MLPEYANSFAMPCEWRRRNRREGKRALRSSRLKLDMVVGEEGKVAGPSLLQAFTARDARTQAVNEDMIHSA
jgi:hypothetical protein